MTEPSQEYELRKQLWLSEHPEASSSEYTKAMREIAGRVGL